MAEEKAKKITKKEAPKKAAANPPAGKAGKPSEKKAAPKKEAKSVGFAVIATGGKQYVVHEGDILNVEKLEAEEGKKVDFTEVLLLDDGKTTKVGEPTVSGAKVSAELVEHGKGKKISVIRFRSKSRYFKNKGHRQPYSRVKVTKIA